MTFNLFLAKESRAGERRVALIPQDVETLIEQGHTVFVEQEAGLGAGYEDKAYRRVGAQIVARSETELSSYQNAFRAINLVVRAKRPNRQREQLEHQALQKGTLMIGALDPLERGSPHIDEYHRAGIIAYSIDQAKLPASDPMNVLAAMSRLAGKLSLQDALSKSQNKVNKVVIIGLGEVGRSALAEAKNQGLPTEVMVGDDTKAKNVTSTGVHAFVVDRSQPLEIQQQKISSIVSEADIVITSARKAGEKAPLLIPKATLDQMKPHAIIVDMALSEGGNVDGSKHDETIITERKVLITNVSGYPKAMPHEASILWSKASLNFILKLASNPNALPLNPC